MITSHQKGFYLTNRQLSKSFIREINPPDTEIRPQIKKTTPLVFDVNYGVEYGSRKGYLLEYNKKSKTHIIIGQYICDVNFDLFIVCNDPRANLTRLKKEWKSVLDYEKEILCSRHSNNYYTGKEAPVRKKFTIGLYSLLF